MPFGEFFKDYMGYWYSPNAATPDIYSATLPNRGCFASLPSTIPSNPPRLGNQAPHGGDFFIGIVTRGSNSVGEYREYVQQKLMTPLEKGEKYCVEFYVSPAERVRYTSNNLGVYFHTFKFIDYDNYHYNFNPQLIDSRVITDSVNWTRIYGIVQADSAYSYMTLGNFRTNAETDVVEIRPLDSDNYSYYYVDDVSVAKMSPEIFFSGIHEICERDSIKLSVSDYLTDVKWAPLEDTAHTVATGNSAWLRPTSTAATYRVRGRHCNVSVVDTVTITVNLNPVVNLGADSELCVGTSMVLHAGGSYVSYKWQDNSTQADLLVNKPGTYGVTVTDDKGCKSHDEIVITPKTTPQFELGPDIVACGSLPRLAVVGELGDYHWSTGEQTPVIRPQQTGVYTLIVTNSCGESKDTIRIYSLRELFIPNVLTLNDDGKNEQLIISGIGDHRGTLTVVDRWGKVVFNAPDYQNDWPFSGSAPLEQGVYYYSYTYGNCPAKRGWLHIFR